MCFSLLPFIQSLKPILPLKILPLAILHRWLAECKKGNAFSDCQYACCSVWCLIFLELFQWQNNVLIEAKRKGMNFSTVSHIMLIQFVSTFLVFIFLNSHFEIKGVCEFFGNVSGCFFLPVSCRSKLPSLAFIPASLCSYQKLKTLSGGKVQQDIERNMLFAVLAFLHRKSWGHACCQIPLRGSQHKINYTETLEKCRNRSQGHSVKTTLVLEQQLCLWMLKG